VAAVQSIWDVEGAGEPAEDGQQAPRPPLSADPESDEDEDASDRTPRGPHPDLTVTGRSLGVQPKGTPAHAEEELELEILAADDGHGSGDEDEDADADAHGASDEEDELVHARGESGAVLNDDLTVHGRSINKARAGPPPVVLMRLRLGPGSLAVTDEDVHHLRALEIDGESVPQLHRLVDEASGAATLSLPQFLQMFRQLLPSQQAAGADAPAAPIVSLFKVLDREGKGAVSRREVLAALSLLARGKRLDRVKMAFRAVDADRDSVATRQVRRHTPAAGARARQSPTNPLRAGGHAAAARGARAAGRRWPVRPRRRAWLVPQHADERRGQGGGRGPRLRGSGRTRSAGRVRHRGGSAQGRRRRAHLAQ
jgi:hypothetical protein